MKISLLLLLLSSSLCTLVVPLSHGAESDEERTNATTEQEKIDFAADSIVYDPDTGEVTASGDVTLFQDGRVLRADLVTYNEKTGLVKAEGKVTIRDQSGNILYVENAELEDSFRDGFIRNVRVLFSDDSRLMARQGERKGKQTIVSNAIYSPCKVCLEEGPQKPLWQIRAKKVTHDENDHIIRYEGVVLEVAGVPIFYSPIFSHPDPTVKYMSGFLVPEIGSSGELGVFAHIPYYFAIDPFRDFTFEPIFSSDEGVVAGGTFRQHTGNGQFRINGSLSNVNERDENFNKTGDHEIRSHFLTDGKFTLDTFRPFDQGDWQWDYTLHWVSDDTYLRRYYADKSDVLESHARMEWFNGTDYASLGIYGFQGLDEEDDIDKTPQALPAIDLNLVSRPLFWNSTLTTNFNTASVYRVEGMNTHRASVGSEWKLPVQGAMGDFYSFSASVRSDVYYNQQTDEPDKAQYAGEDGTYGRLLPMLALDWRMPFIRHGDATQQIIEPLVSVIVAPNDKNIPEITNEDSRNFEFDENNLFNHNRYNGYDLWEGGTRVNYGVRYSLYSNLFNLQATLGQSYRVDDSEAYPVGSGFDGNLSDFVGRLDVSIGKYLDYVHRFRLDKNSFALRRNEMLISGGWKWFQANIRYLDLDRDTTDLTGTELENRQELGMGAEVYVDSNWTVHGSWVQDLLNEKTISYDAGVLYRNECLEFGLRYEQRFTSDRDIAPSKTIHFRLVLKNLG
ncbi:LPS-assembly protein LptD [Emcibacter sp.]|uniref:LPS-assembly protein LptD n=1 Tax=Emcibacter sp. TaxID=1979954 RepID=UPI002AA92707|nr:LPS assembly protein LptD [Emcibacter sp.]